MNLPLEDTGKHYLIYEKSRHGNFCGHAVVHFVRAATPTQAITRYLQMFIGESLVLAEDGSLRDDGLTYPHPLAYVEALYKTCGEWQIRVLPEWTMQVPIAEVFCGESDDGPAEIIGICRRELRKQFPRSRAKAFVWYLRQGTLVTFYRKVKPFQIEILKRYLWNWNGFTERTEEWNGDYAQIVADLVLEPLDAL